MRRTHSHDPNFLVTCVRPGCCKAYKIFSSFQSHIYRNHSELLEIDGDIFDVEASLSYSGSDAGDPHSPRSVGGQGGGRRENRGREGYGRRERKGREAGSLRWREAGEKFKKATFCYLLLLTSSQRNESKNVS